MDKNALEQLLSSYNWWMGVSTVAVAMGILGEYVAHFVFEKEARRNRLEVAISTLFGILVLGGVVGEYIFGKRLSQVSEQLQQIADAEVARSNKDAAQARLDAEAAKQQSADTAERAARVERHAAEENARAAKALAAAETARKNAEGLRLQIAQSNERAAQAELQIARIRQPRVLSSEQQRRIGDTLARFAGQNFAFLAFGDPESLRILANIDAALKIAKWNRLPSPTGLGGDIAYNTAGGSVSSINDIGLKIYVAVDDTSAEAAALAFAAALSAEGIPCEAHRSENLKGHTPRLIIVTVGQKQL
jgi:hypothetical protein